MKKVFFAIVFTSASFAAQAGMISGLHNTKVSSVVVKDLNYTVKGIGANGNGYTTLDNQFPIGPWMSNTSTSGWLSPSKKQDASFSNTIYNWTTTFDLTGFNTATASFSGRFAADDSAIAFLNGTQIGISADDGNLGSMKRWSSFSSLPGAFVAGLNTLNFKVNNSGSGQTGLRVEFAESSATAVPEPDTCAMLLTGLGLMGFMARRRKTS